MSYTKGPWKHKSDKGITDVFSVAEGYERAICTLYLDDNQAEDARLIASAPELLEACKEVLNMPRQFHIPCALVTKLGQAIAKSEGR